MRIGDGVMAVWNDLDPAHEAEFEAWYRRQHIPERLAQPGFLEARRYVTDRGAPRYCAFYWLDSVAALKTPQYLARLAQPTRWTRRTMPWFRNMARSPCTVTLDVGCGSGGMMAYIASIGGSARSGAPRKQLEPVFAACCDDPAMVRMQLWECDWSMRSQSNPEQALRSSRDAVADWIVFIEGACEAALTTSMRRIQAAIGDDASARDLILSPCYRLMWRVSAAEAPPPCPDEDAGVMWSA
jgi:hypothetical protein